MRRARLGGPSLGGSVADASGNFASGLGRLASFGGMLGVPHYARRTLDLALTPRSRLGPVNALRSDAFIRGGALRRFLGTDSVCYNVGRQGAVEHVRKKSSRKDRRRRHWRNSVARGRKNPIA